MSEAVVVHKTLTPRQVRCTDELLALGGARPSVEPELVAELYSRIAVGTQSALERWTEKSLYFTKSQYLSTMRCEGELQATAILPRTTLSTASVAGTVAHRAVQLSYTHPLRPVADYVRLAMVGARSNDSDIDDWWATLPLSDQSDLIMQITSKVTNFIDDFPPLDPSWAPRFEEPMSAKIGKLTIAGRCDLVIGRPRGDNKQTMLLVDLKTGAIKDEHVFEAQYYALVSSLRHGVPPWRSLIYSLASGEYTEPDMTTDILIEAADMLVSSVNAYVDVLTEVRPPSLSPGVQCRWCPAKATCAVALK